MLMPDQHIGVRIPGGQPNKRYIVSLQFLALHLPDTGTRPRPSIFPSDRGRRNQSGLEFRSWNLRFSETVDDLVTSMTMSVMSSCYIIEAACQRRTSEGTSPDKSVACPSLLQMQSGGAGRLRRGLHDPLPDDAAIDYLWFSPPGCPPPP